MTIEAEFHGKWGEQLKRSKARFQALIDNGETEDFVTKNQRVTIKCLSDDEGGEIRIIDNTIAYGEKPRAEAVVIPFDFIIPVEPLSTTHIALKVNGESLLTVRHFPNRFLDVREEN